MAVKKGERLRVEISKMAFGGRGIARVDDFVVFVDQGVVDDVADVVVTKRKKNYAEARLLEVVSPSPLRVEPPCPYSGLCGGCKWQFLDYEAQLEYKRRHVEDALERPGLIEKGRVLPTIPSKRVFGYRNKMEFSCSDRRWLLPSEMEKEDADRGFALGLHVPGTFYKVLDTQTCLLQPEPGDDILEDVRRFIKNSRLPVYGLRSHEGFWRFVMLRHSSFYDQWMVNLVSSRDERDEILPLARSLMEKYPNVVSALGNINSGKAGIAVGEREIHLAGEKTIRDRIGDLEFDISANSFFQTNTLQAQALYQKIEEYAALSGDETVLDLYCGAGTISAWLARSAKKVLGVEISEAAVRDAESNVRLNGIDNCEFIAGDMKDVLPGVEIRPDVMVIDPPRAGMHKNVVRRVLEMAPPKIVYVSCNPAAMARDVEMMKETYRVLEARPVDMFPHTWHIECVAKMERTP
ncbi:putative enzyme [Candidatus Desulfarcum epimagneticum]|uniref:Putative enzyme n=1 Tax=uncultured Desulfobacteraceae bacterium TaxID=218296 RepID=A0A484HJV2_9BACT|nr:putative enzyme [uncultured Desulfobacteraceae bacterium]